MDELIESGSVAAVRIRVQLFVDRQSAFCPPLDIEEDGENAGKGSSMESRNDRSSSVDSVFARITRTIPLEHHTSDNQQQQQ